MPSNTASCVCVFVGVCVHIGIFVACTVSYPGGPRHWLTLFEYLGKFPQFFKAMLRQYVKLGHD